MSLDIRWLAPAAIIMAAPQAIAVQYLTVDHARKLIFADADEFIATPINLTMEQLQQVEKLSGTEARSAQQKVWTVHAKGKPLGLFMLEQVIGKHDLSHSPSVLTPMVASNNFKFLSIARIMALKFATWHGVISLSARPLRIPLNSMWISPISAMPRSPART